MGDRQRSEPATPAIDVLVEAGTWPSRARLKRITGRAITAATARARAKIVPDSEVSIVFSDDAAIAVLNGRYRRKRKPTNVLSFPGTPEGARRFGPLLGDIVLAEETVRREAEEGGLRFEDHLTHLLVHGFLHLLGHDHMKDDEASVMEGLETKILADLGIADPYADPPAAPVPRARGTQKGRKATTQ